MQKNNYFSSSTGSEGSFSKMTFSVVLLLAVLGVVKGNIFTPKEEIIYDYKALVQASVHKPSVYTSEYLINSKIFVTGINDGALVKLTNVTHTVYSGIEDDQIKSNKLPINPEAESITKPFIIHYDTNGKIVEVLTDINDSLWSVNIKKSIASLLQIDLKQLDSDKIKPYGFYSREKTVYGNCQVLYTVDPKTSKSNIITKHHTASSCDKFEWNLNIDANSNSCENKQEEPVSHSSERYYNIEIENGRVIINHIEGFNSILFNPFNANSDTHSIFVNQTLHKLLQKNLVNNVEIDRQNMQKHEINTEFFKEDQYQNKIYDLSGGRRVFNKAITMSQMRVSLEKIHTYLKTSHVRLSDNTHEQHGNVNFLLRQMRYMDKDSLRNFYENIVDFKHEEDKEILDIFLKLLPHTGTYASITMICNLIKEHKVKDDIAVKMVQDIPYYVKYPDKAMLQQLHEFTFDSKISEEIKRTAVLMFASMITKVMHYHSQDDVELQKYIDHYIQSLKETDNYNKQVLYLHALRNIDNGNVMKYLELVIRNSTGAMIETTSHLRVLAMWAAQQGHFKHPKRIENIYWPLLMSRKENLEVRATALQIIMSVATMNDHMKLYWYMKSETDQDLYSTYYTTLKTLSKATVSCHRLRAQNAKKILEFVKEPKITHTLNANHLVDYFDPNFGLGLTNRATVLGSLTNYNFMSFFAQWSPQISNMMFNQLSMYVHIQINKPFKKTFFTTTSAEDISNLLHSQSMNDLSIEIVWLKYDQVVSVSHYNLDNIKDLWNNREDMIKKYQTTSYQIEQIVNGEVIIPTDIGVPVILYVEMPTIKKTKYSFDYVTPQDKKILTTKIRYDTVWWYHQRYGMAVYNPIADVWHGSRKIHVLDAHVPFDTDMSFNLEQKSVKISLNHKLQENLTNSGFQSHVHSQVYIYNDNENDELKKLCPTCNPVTIVTKGKEHRKKKIIWESDNENTGLNYQYAVFDCEQEVSPIRLDYWKKIFTNNENKNVEEYPFLKTLTALKHWQEYILASPDSGMCGLGFMYTPSSTYPATHSDISIHTSIDDTDNENKKINLKTTYSIKNGDKFMKTWDVNIVSEIVGTKVSSIKIYLTSSKPGMEQYKICIEGKQTIEHESITGHWSFYASNSGDSKCVKSQPILQVLMKGEKSDEQITASKSLASNIYKECKDKPGFHSIKCASALTSLRHYIYDIRFEKLPQDYHTIYDTITDILKYMFSDYYVRTYTTGEKITSGNIRLIVDHPLKSENVNISVITPMESYRYEMIPVSNLYWTGLVQPYSYQISTTNSILDNVGLTNKCEVGSKGIINVHNSHILSTISNEWIRLAADCGESCNWEISVKKINDELSILIKYHNDILEIRSHVGYQIILNGKTLSHLATGYYNGPWFNYKVLGHEHKLVLHIQSMDIHIYHDGNTITLNLPKKQYKGVCY